MILDEIAAYTRTRVEALKKHKSLYDVRDEAEGRPAGKDFYGALAAPGLSVIAELKQASPSKGLIAPEAWRGFCAPTVLLARFPSHTHEAGATFAAELLVAHYGAEDVLDATLAWRLVEAGTDPEEAGSPRASRSRRGLSP